MSAVLSLAGAPPEAKRMRLDGAAQTEPAAGPPSSPAALAAAPLSFALTLAADVARYVLGGRSGDCAGASLASTISRTVASFLPTSVIDLDVSFGAREENADNGGRFILRKCWAPGSLPRIVVLTVREKDAVPDDDAEIAAWRTRWAGWKADAQLAQLADGEDTVVRACDTRAFTPGASRVVSAWLVERMQTATLIEEDRFMTAELRLQQLPPTTLCWDTTTRPMGYYGGSGGNDTFRRDIDVMFAEPKRAEAIKFSRGECKAYHELILARLGSLVGTWEKAGPTMLTL